MHCQGFKAIAVGTGGVSPATLTCLGTGVKEVKRWMQLGFGFFQVRRTDGDARDMWAGKGDLFPVVSGLTVRDFVSPELQSCVHKPLFDISRV